MSAPNFTDKTIWTGDNLDILRGMNSECVDLIYLDPPFNSNRDYAAPIVSAAAGTVFKDTWTLSDLDITWIGLIADEQHAVEDLQLLCGHCNSVKGDRDQAYLLARLAEMTILA